MPVIDQSMLKTGAVVQGRWHGYVLGFVHHKVKGRARLPNKPLAAPRQRPARIEGKTAQKTAVPRRADCSDTLFISRAPSLKRLGGQAAENTIQLPRVIICQL